MFITRSLTFYPGIIQENKDELSDEIIIPAYYLNILMKQFDDDETLYVNLSNTNNNQQYLVALGSPHNYDKDTVFVPQWILDLIGCSGSCDTVVNIKKANISKIPKARKIIIKPLDPIVFEIDTLACFEKALMNIHSIKEGITIPVHISELGDDYVMYAHIEKVEPEAISRIVHGEVDVEFINEFEKEETNVSHIPSLTSTTSDFSNSSMIPESSIIPQIPQTMPSVEERKAQIRDSWLKRFHSIAAAQ
jgi:hypothetical protein